MPEPTPGKKPSMKCPTCGRPADFGAPPLGLFCSERCKMIDLGKWLGEEYRVSEPLKPDDFAGADTGAEGDGAADERPS